MNWNIFWALYTLAFAVRYNDISLPVVEYTANGRTYTVVGPKFSATVTKSFSSPFHRVKTDITSNLTTREDLPSVLKLNLRQNSLAGLTESPLNNPVLMSILSGARKPIFLRFGITMVSGTELMSSLQKHHNVALGLT